MATGSDTAQETKYKCTNPKKPTQVRWYSEVGKDGQWYLALVNNKWVMQPEQSGNNEFLLFQYEPSKLSDDVIIQIQGTKYSIKDDNCIATKSNKTLEATDLPPKFLCDWVPADPRMFCQHYCSGNKGIPSGTYHLESRIHSGYWLSFDQDAIGPTSTSTPVFLTTEAKRKPFTSTVW